MMFAARRTTGENPALLRRREQDAKALTIRAAEKEEFRKTYISDWQAKGVGKMEQIQIQNIARGLEEEQAQVLEHRRQQLAELFDIEEEQYREELVSQQPSTLDRLQHTLAIARKFREEKEMRRKQYVQEQYMRLWRENCDDIRTLDSDTYTKHTKDEQMKQIEQHKVLSKDQKAEEEYWLKVWKEDFKQKEARDLADQDRRRQLAVESRDAAYQQILDRERLREAIEEQKKIDRAEYTKNALQEKDLNDRINRQAVIDKRLHAKKVSAYNEDMLNLKKEEKKRQLRQDKEQVDLLTSEYEAELARKRQDRLSIQREIVAYRTYLMERKAEERKLEDELDRITLEYQHQTNQKQDAEWRQNDQRRQQLLAEVQAARQQQIAMKRAEIENTKHRDILDRAKMDLQVMLQKQAEEEEIQNQFRRELESKMDLELQIRHKAYEREAERTRIKQENEAAKLAEAQYREFIRLEQGRAQAVQSQVLRRH